MLLDLLVHEAIHLNIVFFFPSLFSYWKFFAPPTQTYSKTAASKVKLLKVTSFFFIFYFPDQR